MGYPLGFNSDDFTERLHALTDALFTTLQGMKEAGVKPPGAEGAPTTQARPAATHVRLFFAKVSDALATRKKRVIAELSQDGFEVLEPVPPPFDNPAHDETVQQRIKEADLVIHLLDEFPGAALPGETKGYIQRQAEIGRQVGKTQLIWVPNDMEPEKDWDSVGPEDEAYRSFLSQMETEARGKADYDFIRGARSGITKEIRDRLERLKAPPEPPSQSAILLDVHYKDQPYVTDVYRYLSEKGIQPLLNPEVDDPRGSESLFVEQLKRVQGLIVFFGQVAPEWVVERLFTAAKIKTIARYPVRAFGIYVAPPRKPGGGLPDDWSPWTVHPMDNTNGFDPSSFAPLLADLVKARAGAAHA